MSDRGNDYLGLHVLVDDDPRWAHDPVAQARHACAAGAPVVQLRCKQTSDQDMLAWALEIRQLTRESGARFVVNDRFDLALLAEADAVHLGQTDLPPGAISSEVRQRLAIGRSTHTEAQLQAAQSEPVDYVAFGPVFGTTSKASDYSDRGIDALALAVERASPRPLIAIGGIGLEHLPLLQKAGVGGFAVISAVAGAPDPTESARQFIAAFGPPGS